MKKIISGLAAICICASTLLSGVVFAENTETELLNYSFETVNSEAWTAMNAEGSGWTIVGNKINNNNAYLNLGHPYASNGNESIETETFASPIGLKYSYEINLTYGTGSSGAYYIPADSLEDGSLYTAKTQINNGAYMLSFSVEKDGIYGYNSNGIWSRLWAGTVFIDENNYVTVGADVEGAKATIYRNGTQLFAYEMPKSLDSDKFKFGVQGVYGDTSKTAVAKVHNFKLISAENTLQAPEERINLTITSDDSVNALKNSNDWEITGNSDKIFYSDGLKLEGNAAVTALGISTSKFDKNIGSSYYYEIYIKPFGSVTNSRFVGTNDEIGAYYTNKTTIKNGETKLELSVEKDGIYVTDSAGVWTKKSDVTPPVDLNDNYVTAKYSVSVNNGTASVSRDGVYLFSYELPEDLSEDSYSFGLNRKSDGAITHIDNIKLYVYPSSNITEETITELKHIALDFSDDSDFTALVNNSDWKKSVSEPSGNNALKVQNGHLVIGHQWVNATPTGFIETNVFSRQIGMYYVYNIKTMPWDADGRFITSENLTSGEYYTLKTKITNGLYRLEISIEGDGIYGYDSTNTWTKLYNIGFPKNDDGTYVTASTPFTVTVSGKQAIVYRDGTKLFEYELPADSSADSFQLASNGEYGSDADGKFGQVCVNSLSLTSKYQSIELDALYQIENGKLMLSFGTFNEKINAGKSYSVILAAYDNNNEMTSIDFENITNQNITDVQLSIDYDEQKTVKVYVWEDMVNIRPLMPVKGLDDLQPVQ